VGVALLTTAAARAQPVRIQHSPPPSASAWEPLAIEAVLVGDVSPERIAAVEVVVATADGELRGLPLSLSRNALFGEIPGSLVGPPELSYYLRLVDTEGATLTVPPGAPEGGLLIVPVGARDRPVTAGPGETDWTRGAVEILHPAPGEVVPHGSPEVAALIDPPLLEPWDAFVSIDGSDATASADIARDLFVVVPPDSLATGTHRVTFSAVSPAGAVEASWVFFVRERVTVVDEPAPTTPFPELPSPGWDVAGRLAVGWAVVAAETTAVGTLDVFLPYEEVSRPTLDLYASATSGSRSLLLTAQHNPIYDDRLDWSASARTRTFDLDAGSVFPSLSRTTLDWAAGLGTRLAVRLGRSTTEGVAMRMSEADTLAGFGVYSRFAVGVRQSFDWSESLGASVVYASIFDRKESVPEEQRLADPLRNEIVAAVVRAGRGRLVSDIELARSSTSGETEGTGSAVRARLGLEDGMDSRVSLEYVWSDPEHYSAGSLEYEPGEEALQLDYAYRPGERLRTSGWVRVGRTTGPQTSVAEGELELKTYGRADVTWTAGPGDVRGYAVGRYDRTPYDDYDYQYAYGSVGGEWRVGRTRAVGSASWSRSRSPESTDTWTAAADLRHEVIARRWTVRVAGRWTQGEGDETDYSRAHYTLESRWSLGNTDLEAEYWLIDREDRVDPLQSYTEHVVTVSLGQAF
jgi:hypothetical protein